MAATAERRMPRLARRLLAFNLLLVVLPAAGLLVQSVFERKLRAAAADAVEQQAQTLAGAFSESGPLVPEAVRLALREIAPGATVRLRVFAGESLLADTQAAGPSPESRPAPPSDADEDVRRALLRSALAGAFASAEVPDPAGASILLRAVPVHSGGHVVGAVLGSRSTRPLERDLAEIRRGILAVGLACVAIAAALTLWLATTIARPLAALRRETAHLLDRRGEAIGGFPGVARGDEIGDLARALEELKRRLDGQLRRSESVAADVSHEFKNPLAAIRGAAEMLAEVDEPTERRRFRSIVEGEIARLERLLAGMRDMARLDSSLEQEGRVPVALAETVTAIVEEFRRRGVAIALEVGPGAERALVLAAPDRIGQVVENLLDNAASFSPEDGAIEVRLERGDGGARLLVRDRGPGIPEAHLERVFDRFFSYRPAQPRRRGGSHSGLGLAIVKGIVEAYGGGIAAANAEAGGARFTVTLPLAAPGQLALRKD